MEVFKLEGPSKLSGEIYPQGAKNEALQVIAATLLTEEKVIIRNIPEIVDVLRQIELVKKLGGKVRKLANNEFEFDTNSFPQ